MPLWKIVLVLVFGLACGIACVAGFGFLIRTTARAKVFSYKYNSVQVAVVDDETGEPVAKAKVEVTYSDEHHFSQQEPDSTVTNDKGIASVKIAQKTSDWNLSFDSKEHLHSSRQGGIEELPDQMEFKLKKLPKVSLTVPNGYVGPITFNLPKRPVPLQKTKACKEYLFHADASGDVNIESADTTMNYGELCESLQRTCLSASYEDGRQIPLRGEKGVTDSTIALRLVEFHSVSKGNAGKKEDPAVTVEAIDRGIATAQAIYVIGTAKDHSKFRNSQVESGDAGVDLDFDVHDYNWGKTNVGFGSK